MPRSRHGGIGVGCPFKDSVFNDHGQQTMAIYRMTILANELPEAVFLSDWQ